MCVPLSFEDRPHHGFPAVSSDVASLARPCARQRAWPQHRQCRRLWTATVPPVKLPPRKPRHLHSPLAGGSVSRGSLEPRLTVSRHGRVGDGKATCSAAALPRTPSIVLPISLAILASDCLATIRWRSSASASSVQRHRFRVVTACSRVQVPCALARIGCCLGLDRTMLNPEPFHATLFFGSR